MVGKARICPVRWAGHLDTKVRRWFQDPKTILGPYIRKGMAVLDLGCGPGFFTVDIAEMVGKTGRVVAVDVQEGMLDRLRNKIKGTEIESRIQIHKCDEDEIGIAGQVDVAIAFYVMHEISHQDEILNELNRIVKDNGYLLIVEPKLFHVSRSHFEHTVKKAVNSGFMYIEDIKVLFSRGVVLKKCQSLSECLNVAG